MLLRIDAPPFALLCIGEVLHMHDNFGQQEYCDDLEFQGMVYVVARSTS